MTNHSSPEIQPLDGRALAWTFGLGWGGAMLLVGVANLVFPPFGQPFLDAIASVYPGYNPTGSLWSVLVGTAYGVLDGSVGGCLVSWLYNRFRSDSAGSSRDG